MNPEMEKQILEDRAEERKRRLWKAFILLSMGFTASALACLGFSVWDFLSTGSGSCLKPLKTRLKRSLI